MRINEIVSNTIYEVLLANKGVSKVSFELIDVQNLCHTINAINGLPYGKAIINDELLSEYVMPDFLSDLIVPVRIRFADDDSYIDFKSQDYCLPPVIGGSRFLSPEDFKKTWLGILNNLRLKADVTMKQVTTMRESAKISDLDDRCFADDHVKFVDSYFCPVKLSMNFSQSYCYNMPVDTVFDNWFIELMDTKKNSK